MPEHRHFVACIRDGTLVVSDGRFGRKVHAITMASYESGREGRAIRFDDALVEAAR